jgi:cysteinyl-tRNA synthetase
MGDPAAPDVAPAAPESAPAAPRLAPAAAGLVPAGFAQAMDDDLGTPAAVAQLHDSARAGNRALDAGDDPAALTALAQVQNMLSILGLWKLDPAWPAAGGDLGPVVDALVAALLEQRQAARARRDFAAADQLRDRLTALGLTIEDTPEGPRWKR